MIGAADLLTVEETAVILRIHPKTLYEAIRKGSVPGVLRLGRAIRIGRPTLEAWVNGTLPLGKPSASQD